MAATHHDHLFMKYFLIFVSNIKLSVTMCVLLASQLSCMQNFKNKKRKQKKRETEQYLSIFQPHVFLTGLPLL